MMFRSNIEPRLEASPTSRFVVRVTANLVVALATWPQDISTTFLTYFKNHFLDLGPSRITMDGVSWEAKERARSVFAHSSLASPKVLVWVRGPLLPA
jgi:hypothetical protein